MPKKRPIVILSVILLAGTAADCLPKASYSGALKRELEETATHYLENLRWQQPEDAMAYVDPAHLKAIWADVGKFKTIHITDYELSDTVIAETHQTGRVRIAYTRYDDTDLRVANHIRDQRWVRRGRRWLLMFEQDVVPFEDLSIDP